jgi:hypothetical protein
VLRGDNIVWTRSTAYGRKAIREYVFGNLHLWIRCKWDAKNRRGVEKWNGNIGGGSGNTVTFTNVNVDTSGTYQMEVDYLTAAPRSFFISVNGAATTELDLNGSSWSLPASTVIPVQLQAGSNTIQFGNNTGSAPALDRIAIAPVVESSTLTGTISGK